MFPLTGYPPTDVESWRQIFKTEKAYGLNFVRFHSWCPPEAAFAAADIEGIMIHAEGPVCTRLDDKNKARDALIDAEFKRIVDTYGNHPSFIISEIFPNRIRGAAMSVAVASLWIACFILTFTFPILNAKLGPALTFWIYSGICLVGFFGIGLTLHETKGKTLEQIERDLVD